LFSSSYISTIRSVCLIAALLLYCAGVMARIFSLPPSNNEAWFANPAVDLLARHMMGTPVLGETGTWLAGVDQHTYWTMPMYGLVQAPWYFIFGFNIITQRLLTFCCGLALLVCIYWLVRKLSTEWAAVLSVVLIGCDYQFVKQSGLGRMDILCALLGFAGLALYVNLRETRFREAVLLSNTAAAASCMTHPCGMLGLTSLWAVMFYLDRKRLTWREIGFAATPYVAALALWGVYISRAPADFLTQMQGNTKGIEADAGGRRRFDLVMHPMKALSAELHIRYLSNYHSAFLPCVYLLGMLAIIALAWRTRQKGHVVVAMIAFLYFVELTLLEGLKRHFYLAHAVPALAMALAVVLCSVRFPGRAGIAAVSVFVAGLVIVQCVTEKRYSRATHDPRDYFAAEKFLEANFTQGHSLIAPGEFAYRFGFYSGLADDWRIGYGSGKSPEFLVAGPLTREWLKAHRNDTPEFTKFVDNRLGQEYVVVMQNPNYTIYVRRERAASVITDVPDTEHVSLTSLFWRLRPE
jgi:4-amino-4-deoxy-L-arabinose transferase-like glycosyltransferase